MGSWMPIHTATATFTLITDNCKSAVHHEREHRFTMRLTQICFRQHIGRMFKRHWVVQGKKVPIDNGSISELAKLGITAHDAVEFVSGKRKVEEVPKIDLSGVPTAFRKSNLNCRSEFLIDGLEHAGNLTKSAIVDQLPAEVQKAIDNAKIAPSIHETMRSTILRDKLYEYRPFKAPTTPMTIPKLIECCERISGGAASNKVTKNTYFSVPVKKNDQLLSLETQVDHVVWRKPSSSENYSLATPEVMQLPVPSIAPLDFTASLFKNNEDIALNFPINLNKMEIHPQLIMIKSTPAEMKTFHETQASESQFKSRALMSSFVVAASTAISCFGANVKRLPRPIVIHSVLNHDNRFYFGSFQLNTLDLNDTGAKDDKQVNNLWFQSPSLEELYYQEPPKVRNPVFPHHREIGEGDLFKLVAYNEQVLRNLYGLYSQFSSSRE